MKIDRNAAEQTGYARAIGTDGIPRDDAAYESGAFDISEDGGGENMRYVDFFETEDMRRYLTWTFKMPRPMGQRNAYIFEEACTSSGQYSG